jgi:hypothetical protein
MALISINKNKSKKGVFFTFTSLLFLTLLIFSLSIGNNYSMREKIFAIETRIYTMNNFITDIENDVQRAAYIAGIRSLLALENHIFLSGEYLSDLDNDFKKAFINGTINNTNSSLLINNTFSDWIDKIEYEAEKIDIIMNFTINSITLTQKDPWKVTINIDSTIHLKDKKDVSDWNKEKLITTDISIEGLEDPIYLVETNGVIENYIIKSNYSSFTNGIDITNLLDHTDNGYYVAFDKAPSYLMRLQGNFSDSSAGIESLVDIDNLISNGIITYGKSIVDYVYFGPNNPDKDHVSGAPSWFKLDNYTNSNNTLNHHELYEVTDLII